MPAAEFLILALNPGSISTKIAVYRDDRPELVCNLDHDDRQLAPFSGRPILDQLDFRRAAIEQELATAGYDLRAFAAVAGRGGLMRALPGGTYRISEALLDDLRQARYGEHASNLGAFLAVALATPAHAEAFVVDPVSVDEWNPVARLSGSALADRHCLGHALNSKAVARRYAREQGRAYADLRLVVAHLGSGITVSAHQDGRMIDETNAGQEGAFSTERAGGLQLRRLLQLAFSGQYTQSSLWTALYREGGLYSYLGTRDLREVERRIDSGDQRAQLVFEAMAYQIAKDIGSFATVLQGRVDAILLTGGMAHSARLMAQIRPAIEWIAPLALYPGEDELQALAEGALRVLRHQEPPRTL